MFNVGCESSMLTLRLKGVGVSPSVSISAENGILDVGDVLVGDTVTTVLKVRTHFPSIFHSFLDSEK